MFASGDAPDCRPGALAAVCVLAPAEHAVSAAPRTSGTASAVSRLDIMTVSFLPPARLAGGTGGHDRRSHGGSRAGIAAKSESGCDFRVSRAPPAGGGAGQTSGFTVRG